MFEKCRRVRASPTWKWTSSSSGKNAASTASRSSFEKGARASSSSKARRPPTACRTPATVSRARSRISSPATAPCGATAANAKPAGIPTGCPSRSRLRRPRHPPQGRDRELRAREVHPALPAKRVEIHAALGEADRTARLLDQARRSVRHLPPELRRERLVVAEEPLRPRPALPRSQDRLVVGAGGTALSAGEVGQGYRKVADPSVYIRFPLLDDAGKDSGESLLVWTTTPWTLSSNMFAAVKSELEYSVVKDPESPDLLVIASALVETVAGKVQAQARSRAHSSRAKSWSGGSIARRSTTTTTSSARRRDGAPAAHRARSTGTSATPSSSRRRPARAWCTSPWPSATSTSACSRASARSTPIPRPAPSCSARSAPTASSPTRRRLTPAAG